MSLLLVLRLELAAACVRAGAARMMQYEPGEIEKPWFEGVVSGSICQRVSEQVCGSVPWLEYANATRKAKATTAVASLAAPSDAPRFYNPLLPLSPSESQMSQLSRFTIQDHSRFRYEYIEPLTGMARHPFASMWAKTGDKPCGRFIKKARERGALSKGCQRLHHTGLFDISYLLPANGCDASGQPRCAKSLKGGPARAPKNLFFDLGCTVYGEGNGTDATAPSYREFGSGAGPSMPLFFEMYEKRCIVFDELHGWELPKSELQEPRNWWLQVPPSMRHRVHYYDVGVNETGADGRDDSAWRDSRATEGAHRGSAPRAGKLHSTAPPPTSFLRLLREVATEDDFVVVKVDIDGGPELPIVQAIEREPELYKLVDELYFEYHFYFDGIDFGWSTSVKQDTVDTALKLMQRLRHRGVRSHFWI